MNYVHKRKQEINPICKSQDLSALISIRQTKGGYIYDNFQLPVDLVLSMRIVTIST